MTLYTFNRVASAIFQQTKYQSKPIFYWVTVMFNRVDNDRIKEIGPDRACAEWLLKNGAYVRWKGFSEPLKDYNALPSNGNYYIEGVEANNAGICDVGFPYFEGCKHLKEIKFEDCQYVDNRALPCLEIVKDTLTNLEIIDCAKVTEEGLHSLKKLKNLKYLKIKNLQFISDYDGIRKELINALPDCKIEFE